MMQYGLLYHLSVPNLKQAQGGGLEIPCTYDIFVKKEQTELKKEKLRSLKLHADGTASCLHLCFTDHDPECQRIMEQKEFIENF